MKQAITDGVESLMDYIMKNCLWQFNSRAWDRVEQNKNILEKATQIMCKEEVAKETPAERCYWAEAQTLVEEFLKKFPWLQTMETGDIKAMMAGLKERLDYQTITGSLNQELKDPNY
jgi:nitrogenase delta subunit